MNSAWKLSANLRDWQTTLVFKDTVRFFNIPSPNEIKKNSELSVNFTNFFLDFL